MKTKDKIESALLPLKPKHTSAILLSINIGVPNVRHSQVHADQIISMLRKKSKELNVPFITYAEDSCPGVGMQLLTSGDKALCN